MIKPVLLSVILHLGALGLLVFSLDFTPTPQQPFSNHSEIIDAVAIDSKQIEQELNVIKELEQQRQQQTIRKQQELENQLAETQRKSRDAERKRQEEERRLTELKVQQQQQEEQRREEEIKLAEAKRQQEELRKRQLEDERRRQQEAERKRQEELRLAEEAKKQQEAQRLAEQQRQQQAEQDRQDLNVINSYVGRIAQAIEREFNTAGLPIGMSCIIEIRMIPGGDVVEARVVKSSGNSVFDSRAEIAVKRASPLPVPDNPRIFAKMREIRLTFAPN